MTTYEYVSARCRELGYDPQVIRGSNRRREHVLVRRTIADEMRRDGHSFPEIGRALNRDHSTIMFLLQGKPRRPPKRAACWDGVHMCKECAA